MAVVRLEPFRDLLTIQERMNRMFDAAFRNTGDAQEQEWSLGGSWAPLVDIYEKDGRIVLSAELPGVDPKRVDIRLENNVLTLSGERKPITEVTRDAFHRVERSYGPFSRSFSLPAAVDQEKSRAGRRRSRSRSRLRSRAETRSPAGTPAVPAGGRARGPGRLRERAPGAGRGTNPVKCSWNR
jgi:HSP20 family protein